MTFRARILATGVAVILAFAALTLFTNLALVRAIDVSPGTKLGLAWTVLALSFFVALVFVLEIHRLAAELTRRTENLTRAAFDVAHARPPERIAEGPPDELGEVERAFNRMLADLRAAEELLLSRERLANLGRLSAGVAHDLGAPLTEILASAHLLRERTEGRASGEVGEIAEEIIAAAERAQRSLRELIDMGRPLTVRCEATALLPVCKEAASRLARAFGRACPPVEVRADTPDVRARADPERLAEALFNLLRNAAEAIREGRASGSVPEGAGIRVTVRGGGGRAPEVLVEDDGPGVPRAFAPRLFEPFASGKQPSRGTGLGLWTARRVVEAMGGALRFVSAPDGPGAAFSIRLAAPDDAS